MSDPIDLLYWPRAKGPGRGEFIRLICEEFQIPYRDVISDVSEEEGGGIQAMFQLLQSSGEGEHIHPLCPPIIRDGTTIVSQTPAISMYLLEKYNLPGSEDLVTRSHILQLILTISDIGSEAHNTHHPVATAKYYEEQKEEAQTYTKGFLALRIPKFLNYFELTLRHHNSDAEEGDDSQLFLIGGVFTIADLWLFQTVDGLLHAFPTRMGQLRESLPLVMQHHEQVRQRERIAAYLASSRRAAYDFYIFRYYEELDVLANEEKEGDA
jgi:glutathione S-transferase